jgi:ABC-type Fe3+-citrate transport system substrate-binding protein
MKKITFILSISLLLIATSCGNSENKAKEKAEKKSNVKTEKVSQKTSVDFSTQAGFEKQLASYGIQLYPNLTFKDIKGDPDDEVKITYTISDFSNESKEKVSQYIEKQIKSLQDKGWKGMIQPVAIAYKKEGDYKASIQISQTIYREGKIHYLTYTYGRVY